MLASIFIGQSPGFCDDLRGLCPSLETVCIYRTLIGIPARYELVRLLNKLTPDVVFLEVEPVEGAVQVARDVRAVRPEAVVVGVARQCKSEDLPRLAEAGADAVLLPPFSPEKLREALSHALTVSQQRLRARPIVFLPAKAGSGSSTTALNVAAALARVCKQRVLLIDADLHSGLLATLTGQSPEHSIVDALEAAERMEEKLWQKLVVPVYGLDLLASPRVPDLGAWVFSAWDYLHLLSFAMTRYDVVVVDLPEVVNDATEAIVRQAQSIYLLSTPEMPSLVLARRRIAELQGRGASDGRLRVVLNRHGRDSQLDKVEHVLHRKVWALLPNDYAAVRKATLEGRPLSGRAKIARTFDDFARRLVRGSAEDGGSNSIKGVLERARSWVLSSSSGAPARS